MKLNSILTDHQINQWRDQGYVLIQLPEAIWSKIHKKAHEIFPQTRPDNFVDTFGQQPFYGPKTTFPTLIDEIDQLPINEELIKIFQVLLKTEDIRLTQCELWAKYRNNDKEIKDEKNNSDQRMHMDYGNNILTAPSKWDNPDAAAAIIYYDDSQICSGGTKVVPRNGKNDPAYKYPEAYLNQVGYSNYFHEKGGYPHFYVNRTHAENYFRNNYPKIYEFRQKLYEREIQATFRPGTMLLYRLDIWHRGAPINPNCSRRGNRVFYSRPLIFEMIEVKKRSVLHPLKNFYFFENAV